MLRKKLHDYQVIGKPLLFPPYIAHPLIHQVRTHPELNDCETEVKFLLESITGSYRLPDLKVGVMIDEPSDRVTVRWQDTPTTLPVPKLGELIRPVDILMDVGPSCCNGTVK
jgi:hypothetical protein